MDPMIHHSFRGYSLFNTFFNLHFKKFRLLSRDENQIRDLLSWSKNVLNFNYSEVEFQIFFGGNTPDPRFSVGGGATHKYLNRGP
jgi:hypothetical protein